jgi:CRISPR-associated DxTHG motif protein
LREKLPLWYGIPFSVEFHTDKIDSDTASDVFDVYRTLTNSDKLDIKSDILFDITHGFRSMPILVYQALQFDFEKTGHRNIKIIYGEYKKDEKIAYVRDLSQYWELSIITRAKNLFSNKLDGKLLAEKIKPYWESGAKCLQHFSEIVECNFSLQIPEVLKQINNAVDEFPQNLPKWIIDVKDELSAIYKKLNKYIGNYEWWQMYGKDF